jgi:hypothetical protein
MDARADAWPSRAGFDTLEELLEVLTLRQLRLHDRPIVLVNVAGYWDPFGGRGGAAGSSGDRACRSEGDRPARS